LDSLDTTVIDDHLDRIFLYDVNGLPENYILVYSRVTDFNKLWRKYVQYVRRPEPFLGFKELPIELACLRIGKSYHERHSVRVTITHIMIDFSRARVSKKNRRRNSVVDTDDDSVDIQSISGVERLQ